MMSLSKLNVSMIGVFILCLFYGVANSLEPLIAIF